MFKRFYPDTKVDEDFAVAVRAKTRAITAADLQQAFIANMYNTDAQMVKYMQTAWDPNGQKEEEQAFEELDRKLKRDRAVLELKRQKEQEAEREALEKEVAEQMKA